MQDKNGKFSLDSSRIIRQPNELHEEMGVLFFDSDNDNDLDLYAVGGSYEFRPIMPLHRIVCLSMMAKGNSSYQLQHCLQK